MKKKIVSLVLVFSMVLALGIGGTIAWLTANTDPVVNTFTVGNIDIDLTESEELDFKMVPGKVIEKDPLVTVKAGSEACWLFVKIEESDNLNAFITYDIAEGWTKLDGVDVADGVVYYREVVALTAEGAKDAEYPVLANNQVTVNGTVTKAMMDAIAKGEAAEPTLTFTAYAVQKENMADAATAWAAIPDDQK